MRRLLPLAMLLLASGCATAPQRPAAPQPAPTAISPHFPSGLLGLTAPQLVQQLGTPALQIREGAGLKLQFRGAQCILDAYLYAPAVGASPERVTHVDTRVASGADTDQASCIRSLQRG